MPIYIRSRIKGRIIKCRVNGQKESVDNILKAIEKSKRASTAQSYLGAGDTPCSRRNRRDTGKPVGSIDRLKRASKEELELFRL